MQKVFKQYLFILILTSFGCNRAYQNQPTVQNQPILTKHFLPASIAEYGAIPDDNIDDTDAFLRAFKEERKLYLPSGTYDISKSLILPNNIFIEGAPNTIIKATKPMDVLMQLKSPNYAIQNLNLSTLVLDGNKKANTCLSIYKVSGANQQIVTNVQCTNAIGDGAVLKACQVSSLRNLTARKNGGNGIVLQGCNGLMLYSVSAVHNEKSGFKITNLVEGKSKYSGGINVYGLHSEANTENGISINKVLTPISIFGGWIEGNKKNGVLIQNGNVNLLSMRISGRAFPKENIYPVNIAKNIGESFGSNVIVDNCFVVNGQGVPKVVYDANASKNTVITNVKKYNGIGKQNSMK